jgi:PEGA domain
MSRVRRLACLLTCALSSATARAESPDAEAQRHFVQALALVDAGNVDAATEEFEAAYRISPRYEVLLNLGRAHAMAGRIVEASRAFERYLAEGGEHVPRERREQIEATLRAYEQRIGTLVVRSEPPGARLSLDGRPIEAGQPLRLAAGPHALIGDHDSYLTIARNIELAGGETQEISLQFAPSAKSRGWLLVRCDLLASEVSVDGVVAGTAPLPGALSLETGEHIVTCSRAGYVPWTSTVTVSVAGQTQANCVLGVQPALDPRESAPLRTSVNVSGSGISVDGAPYAGSRLPLGPHRVEVVHAGFLPWRGEHMLASGRQEPLVVELVPTPEALGERARRERRIWGYATGASALALGAISGALFVVTSNRAGGWRHDRAALAHDLSDGASADELTRAGELDQRAASIQRLDDVAIATAVAGGALLILSLELLLHKPGVPATASSQQAGRHAAANWRF